jgi:hypothetical protein
MEEEIEALRREVRHLIAMNTAAYLAITSLIATHPDAQQLQLHLVSALEAILGSERLARWDDEQKAIVRRVMETFQQIQPAAHIDPLAAALGDRDPRHPGA